MAYPVSAHLHNADLSSLRRPILIAMAVTAGVFFILMQFGRNNNDRAIAMLIPTIMVGSFGFLCVKATCIAWVLKRVADLFTQPHTADDIDDTPPYFLRGLQLWLVGLVIGVSGFVVLGLSPAYISAAAITFFATAHTLFIVSIVAWVKGVLALLAT